jgi:chromate transporter
MSSKQWSLGHIAEITRVFAKTGFVTFGGGFAMIPMITEELVEEKHWLDQGKLLEILAVAQALPGSLSINISVLVGYEVAGVAGALGAVVGAALPPFTTITVLAALFSKFQGNAVVDAAFKGVRCAVVALIWNAGLGTAKTAVRDVLSWVIFAFTIAVMLFSSLNPAVLILFLAMFGVGAMGLRSWKERQALRMREREEGHNGNH